MGWYWLSWMVLGFGVPETIAFVRHRPQDTLSEWVWKVCDVTPGSTVFYWTFLHFLLAAFMVWLSGHMILRIWR